MAERMLQQDNKIHNLLVTTASTAIFQVSYNIKHILLIQKINEDISDLKSYTITKEQYDSEKEKTINSYELPLTKKEFPRLSREERIEKHIEYLKNV